MPLQNRALPTGEIVAIDARGTLTGNRGIIHGPDKQLSTKRWSHHAWICCVLDWQGRKRDVMSGRKWTELFFLDEATALAAGHRPCGYCRREAYQAFKQAWHDAFGGDVGAKQMDQVLHAERVEPRSRSQKTHLAEAKALPSGAMYRYGGKIYLVADRLVRPFSVKGYGPSETVPEGKVEVLTPPSLVKVLSAGYKPLLHASPFST
ncbi:hypothetical protein SAMN05444003_0984 [Cognatiyoonia sediminum]|uniref:Metal binding domain of Ada n=1 Tax=Cognatiyoonia sediminum TaxID=1508389 RepID=A0A1M5MS22_9RHOB|nr:hypothetical protein [Cognatiyoonia sediminum]SHG80026.1 hypothetical protein SAMN05444003_0984 [Cognatiyoonia sediminum]